MPFALRLGQVFRPKAFQAHVHVIVSTPPASGGSVLVVNWTTLDDECIDDAGILNTGEHPAIRHPSAMAYSRAHLWQAEKIRVAVANGLLEELEPLNPALLNRIVEGGIKSPELRPEWKAMLPKL